MFYKDISYDSQTRSCISKCNALGSTGHFCVECMPPCILHCLIISFPSCIRISGSCSVLESRILKPQSHLYYVYVIHEGIARMGVWYVTSRMFSNEACSKRNWNPRSQGSPRLETARPFNGLLLTYEGKLQWKVAAQFPKTIFAILYTLAYWYRKTCSGAIKMCFLSNQILSLVQWL
jgi:hypothetical protein